MAETDRVKPRALYVEEAIAAALESRWQDALAINQALIERHGSDEDTFNRTGKALTELGDLRGALTAYSHALELNPLNPIAQKNTRKIAAMLESSQEVVTSTAALDVDLFAEEPGKSALTVLTTARTATSAAVAPGDVVELDVSNGHLQAHSSRGILLGEVDAKLARRLIALIETGNRYTAAVARVESDRIEVMVREEYQSAENAGKPSFPITKAVRGGEFRPYAKESLLASRGIDAEALDAADEDEEDEEELDEGGMQTTEDFDDESGALTAVAADDEEDDDDDDDADGDARPEESY